MTSHAGVATTGFRAYRWRIASALIILLPVLALVLGAQISSPAQRAAAAKPPTPSVITAKAEDRVVGDTIVVNGTVIALNSDVVASDATEGATPVVSDVRTRAGDSVSEGQVVVVVSGRPVIVLQGAVPAYRDLQPGMTGPDVTQVQATLRRLHYSSVGEDASGTFGQGTQSAIKRLYQDRGFSSAMTSSDAQDNLDQAKQDVTNAQSALTQAQSSGGPTDEAQANLQSMQQKYTSLLKTTGVTLPRAEVLFIPSFPATVTQSRAMLGSSAIDSKNNTPLMTISGGTTSVQTFIAPDESSLVHVGTKATIQTLDGTTVNVAVTSVATGLEQEPDGTSGYAVSLSADSIPVGLIGASVQVTINAAATSGPVMAVPSSAVYSSADGSMHVTKYVSGKKVDIPVDIGATAGGWVEVRPKAQETLISGDNVVVGATDSADPSTAPSASS